jgi:hypothetical protein
MPERWHKLVHRCRLIAVCSLALNVVLLALVLVRG